MKYFGKLAGNTLASTALALTSDPNKHTPFVAQAAGAKLIAQGEQYTNQVANRALTALAANIEHGIALLDSPAIREDRLEYSQTTGGKVHGFSNLAGVTQGATEIPLGTGTVRPTAWVYHGLFGSEVSDYIRLNRAVTDHYVDEAEVRSPSDVRIRNGGTSVFLSNGASGSLIQGLPTRMAPMRRVETDLPPYSGATRAVAIAGWETDGLRVTADTMQEVFARPGCFVEVFNDNAANPALGNDGLYQVASVSRSEDTGGEGDKVILTRGGLHKVTVSDGTQYTVGDRVSWRAAPNHGSVSTASQRNNFAYVAYIISDDLYLLPASGGDDFPVAGVGGAVNTTTAEYTGRYQVGQLGHVDFETDANDNSTLLTGTLLYSQAGTQSSVTAVVPAGSLTTFNTSATPGSIYIVSPPGFALNPSLVFPSNNLLGGNYDIECRTLTTVREQLQSGAASGPAGQTENPGSRLGLSRAEVSLLFDFMKWMKAGRTPDATTPVADVNSVFSAPARVLGESRWRVTVTNETDAADADTVVAAGDTLLMTEPSQPGTSRTQAVVVSVEANSLILRSVTKAGTFSNEWDVDADRSALPIAAGGGGTGSTFTAGGKTFRVTVLDAAPYLLSTDDGNFVLAEGLEAVYSNSMSSNPNARYQGAGRFVEMHSSRPFTFLFPSGAGTNTAITLRQYQGDVDAISIVDRDPGSSARGTIGHGTLTGLATEGMYITDKNSLAIFGSTAKVAKALVRFATDAMQFSDVNIGLATPIALSDASPYNALPSQSESASILGALHGSFMGVAAGEHGQSIGQRVIGDALVGPYSPVGRDGVALAATINVNGGTLTSAVPQLDTVLSNGDVVAVLRSDGRYHVGVVSGMAVTTATLTPAFPDATDNYTVYTLTNPLSVKVDQAILTSEGGTYRSPAYSAAGTTLTMPVSSTRYVVWTASTNAVTLETSYTKNPGTVLLARVTTNASGITEIINTALTASRIDHRLSLTVGAFALPGSSDAEDYQAQIPHFASIGEACAAIAVLEEDASSQPGFAGFSWEIVIVGPTDEAADPDGNWALPIDIPTDGLVIRGSVGNPMDATGTESEVRWLKNTGLFNLNGKKGLSLRNFRARWNGVSATATSDPLAVLVANTDADGNVSAEVRYLSVQNVHLYGGNGMARFTGVTSGGAVTFRDCTARAVNHCGVLLDSASAGFDDITIDNFKVVGTGGAACSNEQYVFYIDGVAQADLRDISINDMQADLQGITVNDVNERVSITGARITSHFSHGIYVTNLQAKCAAKIDNCYITYDAGASAGARGIQVTQSATGPTCRISNCTVDDCPNMAIYVQCDRTTVSSCSVHDCGSYGISISAKWCRVIGCDVENAGDHGIEALGGATNCAITDCTVDTVTDATGIRLQGNNSKVRGCHVETVTGTDARGISLEGTGCSAVDNTIVDAEDVGIYIIESSCLARGNRISGTCADGISVVPGSGKTDIQVTDNFVSGVSDTGIDVGSNVSRARVSGNTINSTTEDGIQCAGDEIRIQDNQLDSCKLGIECTGDDCVISGNLVTTTQNQGILFNSTTGTKVISNTLKDIGTSGGNGIDATGAQNASVSDNDVSMNASGGTYAIRLEESGLGAAAEATDPAGLYHSVVSNNAVHTDNAIRVAVNDSTVSGNLLEEGDLLINGRRCTVHGNRVQGGALNLYGRQAVCTGNHTQVDVSGTGGRILANAADCVVANNYLGGGDIEVAGAECVITGNHLDNGSIDVDANQPRIVGNYLATGSIEVDDAVDAFVNANYLASSMTTPQGGAIALNNVSSSTVSNNVVAGQVGVTGNGIQAIGTSFSNTFTGNHLDGSRDIYALGGGNNFMSNVLRSFTGAAGTVGNIDCNSDVGGANVRNNRALANLATLVNMDDAVTIHVAKGNNPGPNN